MSALSPLADRVIIKQKDAAEKQGSLVLPEGSKKKPQIGTVVSVGPGRILESGTVIPVGVSVGETVYYASYSGTEIVKDGQTLIVLSEGDILAVDK